MRGQLNLRAANKSHNFEGERVREEQGAECGKRQQRSRGWLQC